MWQKKGGKKAIKLLEEGIVDSNFFKMYCENLKIFSGLSEDLI